MDFSAPDVASLNNVIDNNVTPNEVNNTDAITNLPSIFDLLDLEQNGDLDFAEFKVGLNSIGVALTHDEAIILFSSIDAENEEYINKESFMEWLSSDLDSSPSQMIAIRDKLIAALNAAQEINNPIQDMLDEDEIANLLGNNAQYIQEIEEIKQENDDNDNDNEFNDDDNASDGTFKVNRSSDDDDHKSNNDSDSMTSAERKEIAKAKVLQQSENSENLETSLMVKEMQMMMEKQKYALDREITGRNAYREEDAEKWKKEEIDAEMEAMNQHFRRLSQAELSIDEVQDRANQTMLEIQKQSSLDNVNLLDNNNNTESPIPKPPKIKTTSLSPRNALSPLSSGNINVKSSPKSPQSPIQEIKSTVTLHTTATQPVMITIDDNAHSTPKRNSLSESISYGHGYVMSPNPDISHYTGATHTHGQHQPLIVSGNNKDLIVDSEHNLFLRLILLYLSPMNEGASLHRLWYHGANAVLSIVICAIELSLFVLSLIGVFLCGFGLIFTYFQCLLTRHFAMIDARFSYYFFGNTQFPRFSIFIPKSHQQSMCGALKEYITDPHMLQVMAYFTFIKLPASFILSGIAMSIFAGVTSILLSPLIFWLDPHYFENDLYCLFGSTSADSMHPTKMICNGWAINSFGETFIAFCVFIPALPLTLHISNFTANLLCQCTHNFLSINSGINSKQNVHQNNVIINNQMNHNSNHNHMMNHSNQNNNQNHLNQL